MLNNLFRTNYQIIRRFRIPLLFSLEFWKLYNIKPIKAHGIIQRRALLFGEIV